jgi:hypothetical protein
MNRFWSPNLERKGRRVRGGGALALLVAAAVVAGESLWAAGIFAAAGGFSLFEAVRGWCLLRACGLKTRF